MYLFLTPDEEQMLLAQIQQLEVDVRDNPEMYAEGGKAGPATALIRKVRDAGIDLPAIDWRTKNPGLHRLYVTYAQEELEVYARIIEELSDFSRVNPSIMAGMVAEERARLIRANSAYQEAAWRILAEDKLPSPPCLHADKAEAEVEVRE